MPTFLFSSSGYGVLAMKRDHTRPSGQSLRAVEPVVTEILEHEGLELVDIVFRREAQGWVLRVYIDREGGVTLDDCSAVSHQISDVLDVKDLVPHAYHLEVSSPGLNRPLRREKDFKRFVGQTVRIKTARPVEDRRNFKGRLVACRAGNLELSIDGKTYSVPHGDIAQAHLEYEFPDAGKPPAGKARQRRRPA